MHERLCIKILSTQVKNRDGQRMVLVYNNHKLYLIANAKASNGNP